MYPILFRFSQGDFNLQVGLINWMAAKGYFDDITIPENAPDFILRLRCSQTQGRIRSEPALPKAHNVASARHVTWREIGTFRDEPYDLLSYEANSATG